MTTQPDPEPVIVEISADTAAFVATLERLQRQVAEAEELRIMRDEWIARCEDQLGRKLRPLERAAALRARRVMQDFEASLVEVRRLLEA